MSNTTAREQAINLVRNYYQFFNTGDREAFLQLLSDDVVHDINQGKVETGIPAFRAFLQRMDQCYSERVVDLEIFANDQGTRAAAEFFIDGQYLNTDEGLPPATGQTYHLRVGAFFEIKDGKISRITNYYNLNDWLQQVGAQA